MGKSSTLQDEEGFRPIHAIGRGLGKASQFIRRQKPNYRITVTRAALSSFLVGLTSQYESIYAVALGASPIQLGALNSVKWSASSVMSLPAGWLADRHGVKGFYVMGIGLMALAMAVYGLAPDWRTLLMAVTLISISMRFTGTGCSVLCADQLKNQDRATGQNLCNSIASVFLALSPMIAAVLVTRFGGLTAQSIRPLYYIQFAGYALIMLYVAIRLREPVRQKLTAERNSGGILGDFRRIFRNAPHLKRWIAVVSLSRLPLAMMLPFMHLFANEMKGAGQYTLSMMSVAMVAAHILFGVPLGVLPDYECGNEFHEPGACALATYGPVERLAWSIHRTGNDPGAPAWRTDLAASWPGIRLRHSYCAGPRTTSPVTKNNSRNVMERECPISG